jgi:hypothetical protein
LKSSAGRKEMDHLSENVNQPDSIHRESGIAPDAGKFQIDDELNLKGKICPYTFIESMMALGRDENRRSPAYHCRLPAGRLRMRL